MNKAVFLDKDGTLIINVPYNVDRNKVKLYPETGEALQAIKRAGFLLIMVSNQAGVAKGMFKAKSLDEVSEALNEKLKPYSVQLDGIYYCPHHPDGSVKKYSKDCTCRKPKAGMLLKAAKEFNIDLSQSWMIGDILNDVQAGNLAGCRTILIDNGNETEWILNEERRPDYTVKNLAEAKNFILFAEAAKVMGGIAYERTIKKGYRKV